MPIPIGAHQVPGSPNRVQLASGDVVTRATARTMGAQEIGYKNARAYTKAESAKDEKYYKAFVNSPQGVEALRKAKENNVKPAEFKMMLLAARNGRPHPKTGKPGKRVYTQFMNTYINDGENYDIGDT